MTLGVLDKGGEVTKYNSKCNMILHCKHLKSLKLQLVSPEVKSLYNPRPPIFINMLH